MSAAILIGVGVVGLLALPHSLSSDRLSPVNGILLWTAVLLMRAVLAICLVVTLVFFIPATQLFSLLTHWCLHAVVPFLATHLGFDGHDLGDAAVIVPALVTATSLLSVGFGTWRGARAVRRWLRQDVLGPGPNSSLIVAGSDVVVAAAGIRSPRVVISAGALLRLDDAELEAGLEHEWGHVVRRHRLLVLLGQSCRAVSRLCPGGGHALQQLQLHLERDADDYAVRRTNDPLALASAICKAAGPPWHMKGPALASLSGDGAPQRLRRLADRGESSSSVNGVSKTLAAALTAAALALALATPSLASAGIDQLADQPKSAISDCR